MDQRPPLWARVLVVGSIVLGIGSVIYAARSGASRAAHDAASPYAAHDVRAGSPSPPRRCCSSSRCSASSSAPSWRNSSPALRGSYVGSVSAGGVSAARRTRPRAHGAPRTARARQASRASSCGASTASGCSRPGCRNDRRCRCALAIWSGPTSPSCSAAWAPRCGRAAKDAPLASSPSSRARGQISIARATLRAVSMSAAFAGMSARRGRRAARGYVLSCLHARGTAGPAPSGVTKRVDAIIASSSARVARRRSGMGSRPVAPRGRGLEVLARMRWSTVACGPRARSRERRARRGGISEIPAIMTSWFRAPGWTFAVARQPSRDRRARRGLLGSRDARAAPRRGARALAAETHSLPERHQDPDAAAPRLRGAPSVELDDEGVRYVLVEQISR